jgi:hypothetical protein
MEHPLRCRCGSVEGYVESPRRAGRGVCYCKDCQAFARFLGTPEQILNKRGGTDIIATLPRFVHFTRGVDRLRCMSLSPRGLLRWYADCCRTPVANTPRDAKVPYVGLVSSCLPGSSSELDAAFGPAKIALNTGSASAPVGATPIANFFGAMKIARNIVSARLGGGSRDNPFFRPGTSHSGPRSTP